MQVRSADDNECVRVPKVLRMKESASRKSRNPPDGSDLETVANCGFILNYSNECVEHGVITDVATTEVA